MDRKISKGKALTYVALVVGQKLKAMVFGGWLNEEEAAGFYIGVSNLARKKYKHPAVVVYQQLYEAGDFQLVHTCDWHQGDWVEYDMTPERMNMLCEVTDMTTKSNKVAAW